MVTSHAHEIWVAEQSYEWRRWALAYANLRHFLDQFVDGTLDREMLYQAVEANEMALAAMLEIRSETMSIILAVMGNTPTYVPEFPKEPMVRPQWPVT